MRLLVIITFVLLSLLQGFSLSAQLDPPEVDCISVANNGNVTLSWTEPADPLGEFTAYVVYEYDYGTSTSTLISTIGNYATTNAIIPGADGNLQAFCYYIQTTSNDGTNQTSLPSDTVCSMFLTADPGLVPGTVELSWNYPYVTDPATITGDFTIFMEYPAGQWNEIVTYPANLGNQFVYEVEVCQADLNFQIRYSNGAPCDHYSNVAGGNFQDQLDPSPPEITSVSVDSLSNDAMINWNIPPQGDVNGYIIYECFPGLNPMPLDTIWDPNITSWINPNSDANLGPEIYNIAAFDDCLTNGGEPDPGAANFDCVSSIFLTHQWASCSNEVNLIWTPYGGWLNGVSYYEIYAAEEPIPGSGIFNPSVVLGTVDGSSNTFLHENATLGSSYRYRVRAYSTDGFEESASNYRTATLAYPNAPDFVKLARASVNADNQVEILVDLDAAVATAHTYVLERFSPNFNSYEPIAEQETLLNPQIVFFDNDVDTQERSYRYRIRVENNCGDSVGGSNIGQTILLEGLVNHDRLVNTLVWNQYEAWEEGVSTYRVLRSVDGGPLLPVATLPGSVTFFEDDVSDMLYTEGEFCYLVVADEEPDGISFPNASLSNELCLTQEPVIWVPNAFVVDGFNKEFRPVISFADFDNYTMKIYSRWGGIIFETDDIQDAWDGSFNGEFVQEGMYAYFISVADGAGRIYERRGTLIMLKASED